MIRNRSNSPGPAHAIDRFNRTVVSRWTKDLGTPRNFYQVSLTYDRGSNITVAQDAVHPGYDAAYTMDGRNRLTEAKEGTWGGSSIGSTTRDEQWTLSQPGNWARHKLDLDGDGNYSPIPDELDDTGTFNTANELTARDIDTNSSNNYTLTYDDVGNLTDDGVDYDYVYDWMGRLRKVKTQGGSLVAEYTYNGLGFRIGWHYDTTRSGGGAPDGTVDSYDPWYSFAYDTRWRMVATFRSSDSNPKERFVWHNAGMNGTGGASYIDACVLRDRDINSGWTVTGDGTLEERVYYGQNWRADVSVVLSDAGQVKEWVKYSAYGVPFSITPADFNGDGFVNGTDDDDFDAAYNGGAGAWDARVDLDLSGTLTSADDTLFTAEFVGGEAGGYRVLSRASLANRLGYAGYQHAPELAKTRWHVRHRVLDSETERWLTRDRLLQHYTLNLYYYADSAPVTYLDPLGLKAQQCDSSGCTGDTGGGGDNTQGSGSGDSDSSAATRSKCLANCKYPGPYQHSDQQPYCRDYAACVAKCLAPRDATCQRAARDAIEQACHDDKGETSAIADGMQAFAWCQAPANGCGAATGIKVPDFVWRDCCDQHDECYGTCGSVKSVCDLQFHICALAACRTRLSRGLRGGCYLLADLYYEAISHAGQSAFDDAQKRACDKEAEQ